MKKIKYKINHDEYIGLLPGNTIIDVYILQECEETGRVLVYYPKNVTWYRGDESGIEKGDCGCIGFAKCNGGNEYYQRYGSDNMFINLNNKDTKKYESLIKSIHG